MSAPTQSFTEALMHARNVAYVLKHSVGESQPMIVSLNSGILEHALNEIERAHREELGKAGGQPAHPYAIAPDADQPPFSSPVRNRLAYLENVDFDHFEAWARANGWEPDTSPESENWTLPAWWHPGNMRRKREDWLMDDYKDYLWAPFINETVKS